MDFASVAKHNVEWIIRKLQDNPSVTEEAALQAALHELAEAIVEVSGCDVVKLGKRTL